MTALELCVHALRQMWPLFLVAAMIICIAIKGIKDEIDYQKWRKR